MGAQSSLFRSVIPKGFKLHQAIHPTEFEEEQIAATQLDLASMRNEITRYPLLCATATRELRGLYLRSVMTRLGFSQLEGKRISEIYEKHIYLQSVIARKGPAACPLGHHMGLVDVTKDTSDKLTGWEQTPLIKCRICTEKYEQGFRCDYCAYDLCETCAAVYCNEGHVMTLWTHPDAIHSCYLCNKEPITAGYTCPICPGFDICDFCSRKEGRDQLVADLRDRIDLITAFFQRYKGESRRATAVLKTPDEFFQPKPVTSAMFSRTLAYYRIVKEAVVEEVREKRAMPSDSVASVCVVRCTAGHSCYPFSDKVSVSRCSICELKISDGHYCVSCEYTLCSLCAVISCYEGHAMSLWTSAALPDDSGSIAAVTGGGVAVVSSAVARGSGQGVETEEVVLAAASQVSDNGTADAAPEHPINEDISRTVVATVSNNISVIVPSTVTVENICRSCSAQDIKSGYCCLVCDIKVCDACTAKPARDALRRPILQEIERNLSFMEEHSKLSVEAGKKKWKKRQMMVFISTVGMIAYAKDLRRARGVAEIQLGLIPLIEEAKQLRSVVTCHSDLCIVSLKELNRHVSYDYTDEEQAHIEIRRIKRLLRKLVTQASPEARAGACLACPLGHGMEPVFHPHVDFSMISILGERCSNIESIPPTPEKDDKEGEEVEGAEDNEREKTEDDKPAAATTTDKPPPPKSSSLSSSSSTIVGGVGSRGTSTSSGGGNNTLLLKTKSKSFRKLKSKSKPLLTDSNSNSNNKGGVGSGSSNLKPLSHSNIKSPSSSASVSSSSRRLDYTTNSPTTPTTPTTISLPPMMTMLVPPPQHHSNTATSTGSQSGTMVAAGEHGGVTAATAPYSSHKIVKYACRACLRGIDTGSKCSVCEYYLCDSCSVIYCRKCHVMKLWNNPNAVGNRCDMCCSLNITSGYECSVCNIVVCDMCTRRENRDSLKTWPYNEMKSSAAGLKAVVDELTKKASEEAIRIAEVTSTFPIDETAVAAFNFPEGMTLQMAALERSKDLDAARFLLLTVNEAISLSRPCSMSSMCVRMYAFVDLCRDVEKLLQKDICYSEDLAELTSRFEALNDLY